MMAKLGDRLQAVQVGHVDVGDDQVGRSFPLPLDAFSAIGSQNNLIAGGRKGLLQQSPHVRVVVDSQDSRHYHVSVSTARAPSIFQESCANSLGVQKLNFVERFVVCVRMRGGWDTWAYAGEAGMRGWGLGLADAGRGTRGERGNGCCTGFRAAAWLLRTWTRADQEPDLIERSKAC